jgi:DNA-binding response OmpR family regulator
MDTHILLIAEEEEVLDFVQAVFEFEGYQVRASRTGGCLQEMGSSTPDLILLDALIPPTSGRALTMQQWREQGLATRIPLLLFSARLSTSQVLPGSSLTILSAQPCSLQPLLQAVVEATSSASPSDIWQTPQQRDRAG